MRRKSFHLPVILAVLLLLLAGCKSDPLYETIQGVPTASSSTTTPNGWTSFVSTKTINAIVSDRQGNVWIATSGGVVRWDTNGNHYTLYTTLDGLAHGEVKAIAVSSAGEVWAGTRGGGVSRFDGHGWTTFDETNGLPSNWANAVAITADGTVWVGTEDGLCRIEGRTCQVISFPSGEKRVEYLATALDGSLWLASLGEVFHFDGQAWTSHPLGDFLVGFAFTPDGAVWVAGTESANRFDGKTWQRFDSSDGVSDKRILSIGAAPDGVLWLGTATGVSITRDGKNWSQIPLRNGLVLPDDAIAAMAPSTESMWIGTFNHGIYRYTGQSHRDHLIDSRRWTKYEIPNEPSHHDVEAIAFAPDGVAWFATAGGVSSFDGKTWKTYSIQDGRYEQDFWSIGVESNGTVWLGSRTNGVSKFDGKNWETFMPGKGMNGNFYYTGLAITPDDHVWFGNDSVLAGYWRGTWQSFSALSTFDDIQAIATAPDGSIWFGRWQDGLAHYNGKDWKVYTKAGGLPDEYIHTIAIDPQGIVWIGTNQGAVRFNGENWKTFTTADGLAGNEVRAIAISLDGTVWCGTEKNGASRFDGNNWTSYTPKDGLISNNVNDIEVAPDGAIWFATANGISRFTPLH